MNDLEMVRESLGIKRGCKVLVKSSDGQETLTGELTADVVTGEKLVLAGVKEYGGEHHHLKHLRGVNASDGVVRVTTMDGKTYTIKSIG